MLDVALDSGEHRASTLIGKQAILDLTFPNIVRARTSFKFNNILLDVGLSTIARDCTIPRVYYTVYLEQSVATNSSRWHVISSTKPMDAATTLRRVRENRHVRDTRSGVLVRAAATSLPNRKR